MPKHDQMRKILDFAIKEEEAAVMFYTKLSSQAQKQEMKKVFRDFAAEERAHKRKLAAIMKGSVSFGGDEKSKVPDLKVGNYLTDVQPRNDMTYREALVVAMKKEKAAFEMYSDLSERVEGAKARELFLSLSKEEARHKLRFEIEYEDNFMTEKGW
jgi:rubrerythrin